MSSLFEQTYNPDVLSCLANLSSDEVSTPPELANQMLDMLPQDLWSDPDARFLDPACKSGVFLREIAKRLIEGLEGQFPDLQERLDHIYREQIFGIAITEITSLMSRRSLYCSKYPNSKYSVVRFDDAEGNIRFRQTEHTWGRGAPGKRKCMYCGASEQEYQRDKGLEQHAYEFIHIDDIEKVFDMKFDVIIGNPPYQLNDGGNKASAKPIYQLFVEQAKKLNPRYLTMIIPARWYAGGKGLESFRSAMLNDNRITRLVDFVDSKDCFPGVDIAGGICYFLWDRDASVDECAVTQYRGGKASSTVRKLNEFDTFIRDKEALSIIHKVQAKHEKTMSGQVSSRKPFGLATNVKPLRGGILPFAILMEQGHMNDAL